MDELSLCIFPIYFALELSVPFVASYQSKEPVYLVSVPNEDSRTWLEIPRAQSGGWMDGKTGCEWDRSYFLNIVGMISASEGVGGSP